MRNPARAINQTTPAIDSSTSSAASSSSEVSAPSMTCPTRSGSVPGDFTSTVGFVTIARSRLASSITDLHVEYHDFDLATCGDINGTEAGSRSDVETAVAPSIGDVKVAKVNHHGSSFSSNQTYVSTLSAEVSIISVGKNSFGHPSATVVARWDAIGDVFQTQSPTDNALIDGDIAITTSGVTSYSTTASASGRSIVRPMDENSP